MARPAMKDLPRLASLTLALATVPLLWAPWLHVQEEPLCIMQDPCPEGDVYDERGYATVGAVVAGLAVLAAILTAWPAVGGASRWAATVLLGVAALLALDPSFPGFRVFAETSREWGAVAASLVCLTAAALAAASAWTVRTAPGSRPA